MTYTVSANFFTEDTYKNWEVSFSDYECAKASFLNATKVAPTMFEGMPYSILFWELAEDYNDLKAEFRCGLKEPKWY